MKKDVLRMQAFIENNSDTDRQTRVDLSMLAYIKAGKKIDHNDKEFQSIDTDLLDSRELELRAYMERLESLKQEPLVKQRTPEWFELRNTMVTASVLDDVIKDNNIKIAKKKAGVIKDTTNYASIPALKWGTMFEDMATRSYSASRNNIGVHEFGLLTNKDIKNFGASPDGINDMGIMIEIKCPYSRQIIDNSIPEKYFLQIQGQLAVCGLNECDYVECNFGTFEDTGAYIQFVKENPGKEHGVIAEFRNDITGEYKYEYSPSGMGAEDALAYANKCNGSSKVTPWHLKEMNIQRVRFDAERWSADIVPKINSFWEKVEECKLLPIEEPVSKPKYAFIEDD